MFLYLTIFFCILQLSEGDTRIDFYTTPKCPNFNGVWCVRAYHLHFKYFSFNNLGVTDMVCQTGDSAKRFHYINYINKDQIPFYLRSFLIEVGFRHNCTYDGAVLDYNYKYHWVNGNKEAVNIVTDANIKDEGRKLFHALREKIDWWSTHFNGIWIENKKFYDHE